MSESLQGIENPNSIDKKKTFISSTIYEKMKEDDLSIRKLAKNIDGIGPAQVSRILHNENYNIMTLLKILDYLNLEIDIKKR